MTNLPIETYPSLDSNNFKEIGPEIDSRTLNLKDSTRLRFRIRSQGEVSMHDVDSYLPLNANVFGSHHSDKKSSDESENTHTGSPENLKHAVRWLNICERTHGLCTCTTDPYTLLPKRVLCVSSSLGDHRPYILESQNRIGRYATLSHRWPAEPILRTLKDNLARHKVGIDMSALPISFQHAVQVCRRLGIDFLWIDSLCIVQDSLQDWKSESVQMGTYYWNSHVNIAIAQSTEGETGCFRTRDPLGVQPCTVWMRFPQDRHYRTKPVLLSPYIKGGYDWRFKQSSILDARAWVLQERLLAPRTLFFGEHQMFFSCLTMEASEARPHGELLSVKLESNLLIQEFQHTLRVAALTRLLENLQKAPRWMMSKNRLQDKRERNRADVTDLLQSIRLDDPQNLRETYDEWYSLVEEYNCRCMTKETDILPAISGLAAYFQMTLGDRYLAGLWASDLVIGLLWSVDSGSVRTVETKGTPSWSWASLRTDTLTMWYLGPDTEVARFISLLEAETICDPGDLFGTVRTGWIKFDGYLKLATAVASKKQEKEQEKGIGGRGAPPPDKHLFLHTSIQSREENGEQALILDIGTQASVGAFFPDWNFDSGFRSILCVPILEDRNPFMQLGVLSLVVVPNENGTWRRVGLARISTPGWFSDAKPVRLTLR